MISLPALRGTGKTMSRPVKSSCFDAGLLSCLFECMLIVELEDFHATLQEVCEMRRIL